MKRVWLSVIGMSLFVMQVFANQEAWTGIDTLLKDGEFEQAKVLIEALDEDDQGRKLFYQGRVALSEGEEKQAIKLIKRSVKQDAENADYHAWLGMAYGARALSASIFGKASAAGNSKKSFIRALEFNPDNTTALSGLSTFYAQAPGIMGGDNDKALALAQHFLTVDFDGGSGALIQAHFARDEFTEAFQVVDNWIENGVRKDRAYTSKLSLYARDEEWDQCFSVLDDWARDFSSNSRYLYLTGAIAVLSESRLEQGKLALQQYLTQTDADEDFSPERTHYRLGQTHAMLGEYDAARSAYETALTFEPEFEEAKEALKKIRKK